MNFFFFLATLKDGGERLFCKIMATALENKHFDLEFFMKSTDVGLYKVAKGIFSYMNPPDLANVGLIGETNKTFDNFLKKEEDFLLKKFEEVTFKIRSYEIGQGGETLRYGFQAL